MARKIHHCELLAITGRSPRLAQYFGKKDLNEFCGNAYIPHAIGSVIAPFILFYPNAFQPE